MSSNKKIKSAITTEGRENQLIALAMDLVEKRIVEGTATSQEVTHFLRLGSTRERLEKERLEKDIDLLVAKKINLESLERMERIAEDAVNAMRRYSGSINDEEDI